MELPKILIVDDDREMVETLASLFEKNGYGVSVALSGGEALEILKTGGTISLALVDLMMPLIDGIALMEKLKEVDPDIAVILMTGYGTIQTAVEAIKRGADDFILKPFDKNMILKKVGRAVEMCELREKVAKLQDQVDSISGFEEIVAISRKMREVVDKALVASQSDIPVLIIGETGTGKEILARAIHRRSQRRDKPFVPINCGALPKELIESELFGYKKGSFTGAIRDHKGLFVSATGGTLFLDEISEMPKDAQVKLLRVLQDGRVRAIGDTREIEVDVRVLSASNRPVEELKGQYLREDLYYRISTLTIVIPPLRERREDIPLLAERFVRKYGEKYGHRLRIEKEVFGLLQDYPFYGNVRELESMMEGIIATAGEKKENLTVQDIKTMFKKHKSEGDFEQAREATLYGTSALSLEQVEKFAIEQALRVAGGNKSKAAEILGISRDSLYRKIKRYRISF
ncbi:MAG TPA: sigma-54 dependent transcriptional regulator [Candidatus Limnocylindrales bacterium]|nr:sigma-54 dependent transcriptional regulator [Candidatus Limnocylindrales bacterium]